MCLVGELSLKSAEFRTVWARHDVRAKTSGSKRIRSPEIGEVNIQWATFDIAAARGQILVTYSAEPDSESPTRLDQLNTIHADSPCPDQPHRNHSDTQRAANRSRILN